MKPYSLPELITLTGNLETIEDCDELMQYISENAQHYNTKIISAIRLTIVIFCSALSAIERFKNQKDESE